MNIFAVGLLACLVGTVVGIVTMILLEKAQAWQNERAEERAEAEARQWFAERDAPAIALGKMTPEQIDGMFGIRSATQDDDHGEALCAGLARLNAARISAR